MTSEIAIIEKSNPLMALQSWDELLSRAEYFAKSQLIPSALRGKPADVAIILQYGVELGIPPLQALNGIDVVQGKPTVSPQLAIALIRSKVPKSFIKIETDEVKLVSRVTMARDRDHKDEAYTATWDMAKAQKMGLTGKDNYQKQPATMIEWRATMQAARKVFPDIIKGLDYSPDEIEDFTAPTQGEQKAASIAAALHPEKEVHAIVIKSTPEIESISLEPASIIVSGNYDPLADYEIPIGEFRGRKLKDIDKKVLAEGVLKVNKHFSELNKPITAKWLEFCTRAEQYLNQVDSEDEISFENFDAPIIVK